MIGDPNLQQLTAAALIAVGTVCFAVFCWLMVGRQRTRSADAEMRSSWEQTLATTPMPRYDGDTYAYEGWGAGELRRLFTDPSPTLSDLPAVPVSEMSGPLPVTPFEDDYDPEADAAAYIKAMEARTQAFIAAVSR